MSKSMTTLIPLLLMVSMELSSINETEFLNRYKPVCGIDQITYLNTCHLRMAGEQSKLHKTVDYRGPCRTSCDEGVRCPSYGHLSMSCRSDWLTGIARCYCDGLCPYVDSRKVCGNDGEFHCLASCPDPKCRDRGLKFTPDVANWTICMGGITRNCPRYQYLGWL